MTMGGCEECEKTRPVVLGEVESKTADPIFRLWSKGIYVVGREV